MRSFLSDLRYAWRKLLGDSGAAAVAILSIGVGIGVSTAIFGAVDRILLAALPYPDAERVIALRDRTADGDPLDVAYGNYWRSCNAIARSRRSQSPTVGSRRSLRRASPAARG